MKLEKMPFEVKLLFLSMVFFGTSVPLMETSAAYWGQKKDVWTTVATKTLLAEYSVISKDDFRIKSALIRPDTPGVITSMSWTKSAENIIEKSWGVSISVSGSVKVKTWKGFQEASGKLTLKGSYNQKTVDKSGLSNSYDISNDPDNGNSWYDSAYTIPLNARFDISVEEYFLQEKADLKQKEQVKCEPKGIINWSCNWVHVKWYDEYDVKTYTYLTDIKRTNNINGQRYVDEPVRTEQRKRCVSWNLFTLECKRYQYYTVNVYSPYYSWLNSAYNGIIDGSKYRSEHTIVNQGYDGGTTYRVTATKSHYKMGTWSGSISVTASGTWGKKIMGVGAKVTVTIEIGASWSYGTGTNDIAVIKATFTPPHTCTLYVDAWTLPWNSMYLVGTGC